MSLKQKEIDFTRLYKINNSKVDYNKEMRIAINVEINVNEATAYTSELIEYFETTEVSKYTLKKYKEAYLVIKNLITTTFANLVSASAGDIKVVDLYSAFLDKVERFLEQINFYLDIISAKEEIESGNTLELDEAFEL